MPRAARRSPTDPAADAARTARLNALSPVSDAMLRNPPNSAHDRFAMIAAVSGGPTSGVALFFVVVAEAYLRRRPAPDNPWGEGATTLEWTLSSPPPFHQFNELPRIA